MTRQEIHVWMVDAIEEGMARIEVDGDRVVTLPTWLLPFAVSEGEVLRVSHRREQERSALVIERDPDATAAALRRSARQLADIPRETGAGGDIVL